MPSYSLAPASPVALTVPARPTAAVEAVTAIRRHDNQARGWLTLAVGSLVLAGLLSLSVVIGRLPVLSRIIDDPLFFKRCLVVHVDLALVVWFYAFIAALLALGTRGPRRWAHFPLLVSAAGVLAMLAGALARGAEPILANYIPVIDQPLFRAGLAAFSVGVLLTYVRGLAAPERGNATPLPADAQTGLRAAAMLVVAAAATWVSARAGLPAGVDPHTRAEFLAWGPGHVLQAANTAAMLAVWLWLINRITGRALLSSRAALAVFSGLVLPHCAMPLLTARGTLDTLYHTGATTLMRWTIFPTVLAVAFLSFRHLRHHRTAAVRSTPAGRLALTGLAGSIALAILGMLLGACIRGSTTIVPAHYHASLGAVTIAFMTAAYFIAARAREVAGASLPERVWRVARRQLAVFGCGQAVFALGFALGGAYGLGRKAYAAEQHVRGAGEVVGLLVMGVGGLVAAAGGLWFLFLIIRELRAWWTHANAGGALSHPEFPPASPDAA